MHIPKAATSREGTAILACALETFLASSSLSEISGERVVQRRNEYLFTLRLMGAKSDNAETFLTRGLCGTGVPGLDAVPKWSCSSSCSAALNASIWLVDSAKE